VHRSDPGLMLGYWKRSQEEALVYRGEWFVGGDLAVIDAEGYVFHRGRANDLMKALGYRVSPLEVEAALAEHPSIAEVACAEVRVRGDVTVIAAFVVPHAGTNADAADIERFAAERLAAYKRPRAIVFVEALPRTANGKFMRQALRLPDGFSTT
jgi:acetyl-CoA synthetase